MRELIAGAVLLVALVVAAVAPAVWASPPTGTALASNAPTRQPAPSTVSLSSWKGKDGGNGFVVCGSSDTWMRPSRAEELARLAADPRYRTVDLSDGSPDAMAFNAPAVLYDGAGASSRSGLVVLSGLWSDPNIGQTGCTSAEPQVWLFGYAPASYAADDPFIALLRVTPAPGYRMVVITGAIRPTLVVADKTKLAVFQMQAAAVTPRTSSPDSKPVPSAVPTPVPAVRPSYEPLQPNEAPRALALPAGCRIEQGVAHPDGMGATWTVHCGSALANLSVVGAAIHQGWTRLDGPPLGVGIQSYTKDQLTMQLAYRLDGPGFADPFQLVQYWRPFAGGPTSTASPLAYVRVPVDVVLPGGCDWRDGPAGFTNQGAYRLPFSCPGMPADQIQGKFTRALESQGWRVDNGGFGFLSYAKGDLRLDATFANGNAQPSDTPTIVEAYFLGW